MICSLPYSNMGVPPPPNGGVMLQTQMTDSCEKSVDVSNHWTSYIAVYKVLYLQKICHTAWQLKGLSWRYCSDMCSHPTYHKGNEISSGKNDYLSPLF